MLRHARDWRKPTARVTKSARETLAVLVACQSDETTGLSRGWELAVNIECSRATMTVIGPRRDAMRRYLADR